MELTNEQLQALKGGEAVPVELDHTECVLVRRDVYEKVRRAVEYDDSEWTDEEITAIASRTMEGADDPQQIT